MTTGKRDRSRAGSNKTAATSGGTSMSDVRLRYEIDDRVVFKVSEAARMLDCDVPTVYKHIHAGTLLAIDIRLPGAKSATWRVTRASLESFIAGATHEPLSAAGGRR